MEEWGRLRTKGKGSEWMSGKDEGKGEEILKGKVISKGKTKDRRERGRTWL